jgi:hypothetical protein
MEKSKKIISPRTIIRNIVGLDISQISQSPGIKVEPELKRFAKKQLEKIGENQNFPSCLFSVTNLV